MGESGRELGADLYDIHKAGSKYLPNISAEYGIAYRHTQSAGAGGAAAFQRSGPFGSPYGPAYQQWEIMAQRVEDALRNSEIYLDETGQALVMAANAYADENAQAKRRLDELRGGAKGD